MKAFSTLFPGHVAVSQALSRHLAPAPAAPAAVAARSTAADHMLIEGICDKPVHINQVTAALNAAWEEKDWTSARSILLTLEKHAHHFDLEARCDEAGVVTSRKPRRD